MSHFVTVSMFSGRRDPTWELSLHEVDQLNELLGSNMVPTDRDPFTNPGLLGYKGIKVVAITDSDAVNFFRVFDSVMLLSNQDSRRLVTDIDGRVEKFLIDTEDNPLAEDEKEYVRRRIFENERRRLMNLTEPSGPTSAALSYPANPQAPIYDPDVWNNDLCIRENNNCYNYASNTLASNWAQPGTSCGKNSPAPYYCGPTILAAECDGLVPIDDPTKVVLEGYICALFVSQIKGFYDYHWFRLDFDGMWSHKRGDCPATNLDSSRTAATPIADPLECNRGDYDQFCSFFQCIPTRIKILGSPKLCP